jgi:hypothetical protein
MAVRPSRRSSLSRWLRASELNRPKDSGLEWLGSRERQRGVIRPLAGARGYRNVPSAKDVGLGSRSHCSEAWLGSSDD